MNDHIPDPTKMINDGGPAFPRTGADGHTSPQSGMTIRDYFAAAALQGLLANGGCPTWDDDAKAAYAAADAMLKARETK
jgi:hypothetical protein